MERLFDQQIGNREADPLYVIIRDDERNVYTREWLESLWETYSKYADTHFLAEFTRQTHPRFWEMYLTCALLDLGNIVERTQTDQPDICLNHNGKSIWIEAKAPTQGSGENAVPGFKTGGTTMVPLDEMTLRFTSVMGDARRQRQNMIKSRRIGEAEPYVVAVNTWNTYWIGTNKDLPQITRALFGVGNLQYSFETDEAEYSHQGSISKKTKEGVKQIEIGLFDNPDFAGISAVIQSSAHTGFGRVQGHLGRDLVLLRNPFAINPLADGDIDGIRKFKIEPKGQKPNESSLLRESPSTYERLGELPDSSYNSFMSEITPNMQGELRERVAAGSYASIEDLIRCALEALDRQDILEGQLIEGVEAESDIDLAPAKWAEIRQEGLDRLKGESSL